MLPLSYNRDLQEDKVHLFEGIETTFSCVQMMTLTLQKASWKTDRMRKSLAQDFSNATDLADDLVGKGVSFREAHEIVGALVQKCLGQKKGLEELSLEDLQDHHPLFDVHSLPRLRHQNVMAARTSEGGTSPQAVQEQIQKALACLSSMAPYPVNPK